MAILNFDATKHEPTDPNKTQFDPLPPGWYKMAITESEVKNTNAGNGTYLQLTLVGIEEPAAGRKVWARINLTNPSAQCVNICRRQLGDLCHATGVLNPKDSIELHHKPIGVKVDVSKWEYQGQQKTGN